MQNAVEARKFLFGEKMEESLLEFVTFQARNLWKIVKTIQKVKILTSKTFPNIQIQENR